jgi:hypothetical protein
MTEQPLKILKLNIKWVLTGIIILILGYIILSINLETSSYENKVYAWHKMTLAPITIIAGYIILGLSIFKTNKQ